MLLLLESILFGPELLSNRFFNSHFTICRNSTDPTGVNIVIFIFINYNL
jgi:hypothetical protein